jgi:hypothetical protein
VGEVLGFLGEATGLGVTPSGVDPATCRGEVELDPDTVDLLFGDPLVVVPKAVDQGRGEPGLVEIVVLQVLRVGGELGSDLVEDVGSSDFGELLSEGGFDLPGRGESVRVDSKFDRLGSEFAEAACRGSGL